MSNTVISVEHLTKQYDLGVIGTGTLTGTLTAGGHACASSPTPTPGLARRMPSSVSGSQSWRWMMSALRFSRVRRWESSAGTGPARAPC